MTYPYVVDFREYAECLFTDVREKGSDDCLDILGQESNHYAGSISMESQAKPNKSCATWRPINLPGVRPVHRWSEDGAIRSKLPRI